MAQEQDSLGGFDFNRISKPGKYLKWEAGKSVTVRILTKDPVLQQKEFTNDKGEINLRTSFCFIIWNFTDEIAQILTAGPSMAKTFQRIGKDEDYGANLQKVDIKITPDGEKLNRVYDINVLRHSGNEKPLTREMVEEARKIDLDNDVKDNKGRLSQWEPNGVKPSARTEPPQEGIDEVPPEDLDTVADVDDEPISLDDIPF
jgi:hypothetical protein